MMIIAAILALLVATLQVSLSALGTFMAGFWLVALICSSEVLDFDSQMVMAVVLGLVLDYYAGADFGLHMVFAILVVLVGTLVRTSFEHTNKRLINFGLANAAVVIYSLARSLPSINVASSQDWMSLLASVFTKLAGVAVWYVLALGLLELTKLAQQKLSSGVQFKFFRRLVK